MIKYQCSNNCASFRDRFRNKRHGLSKFWNSLFHKHDPYYYPQDDPEAMLNEDTKGKYMEKSNLSYFSTTKKTKKVNYDSIKIKKSRQLVGSVREFFKRKPLGASPMNSNYDIIENSHNEDEKTSNSLKDDIDIYFNENNLNQIPAALETQLLQVMDSPNPQLGDSYNTDMSLLDFSFHNVNDPSLKAIYNNAKETENYLVSSDFGSKFKKSNEEELICVVRNTRPDNLLKSGLKNSYTKSVPILKPISTNPGAGNQIKLKNKNVSRVQELRRILEGNTVKSNQTSDQIQENAVKCPKKDTINEPNIQFSEKGTIIPCKSMSPLQPKFKSLQPNRQLLTTNHLSDRKLTPPLKVDSERSLRLDIKKLGTQDSGSTTNLIKTQAQQSVTEYDKFKSTKMNTDCSHTLGKQNNVLERSDNMMTNNGWTPLRQPPILESGQEVLSIGGNSTDIGGSAASENTSNNRSAYDKIENNNHIQSEDNNSDVNSVIEYFEVPTFRGSNKRKVSISKFINKQKSENPKVGTTKLGKTINYIKAPLTFKNKKFFDTVSNDEGDSFDNFDSQSGCASSHSSSQISNGSKGSLKFSDSSFVYFFDKQEAIGSRFTFNEKTEFNDCSSGNSSFLSSTNSLNSNGSKSILKRKVNPMADLELTRAEQCDSIDVQDFLRIFKENEKRRMQEEEKAGKMRERQMQFYYSEHYNNIKGENQTAPIDELTISKEETQKNFRRKVFDINNYEA